MHQHINQDVGWLRLQDAQRETENRQLLAGECRSAVIAAIKRVFGRTVARSAERRRETA
jgi:hypothetical protein